MARYVYDFTEGGRDMADLLGGKGSNLAEMTRLGLPVPPGFTITTEACRAFLTSGGEPAGMFSSSAIPEWKYFDVMIAGIDAIVPADGAFVNVNDVDRFTSSARRGVVSRCLGPSA